MKIAYCGYDFFSASLRSLLNADKNVYRLFTVPDRGSANTNQYMNDISTQFGIPISDERIDDQTIRQLEEEGCELLITAAYNYKIPSLDSIDIRGINVHPTLLPQGRGEWPLPWVILTQQQQSGISIHKLTQEYDAGDILLQRSFPVDAQESLETLSAKVQMYAKDWLLEVVNDFSNMWEHAKPQSGEVSNWGVPPREERTLDWHFDVEKLDRICRAFGKFGCYAKFNEQDWMVYLIKGWKQPHNYNIGDVVHRTSTETIVAAGDGLVSLIYFQKIRDNS